MSVKRSIHTDAIHSAIIAELEKINFILAGEVVKAFSSMKDREESALAKKTLELLGENARIAGECRIPLCQDCGSVVIFMEIGQQLVIEGDALSTAVDAAVGEAYRKFYLRKSIVRDPLRRENTGTNAPAFLHTDIVPGDALRMMILLKGGGSENMTALKMLRPTASLDDIVEYIAGHVREAGPNPCPPLFLGIGLGGTADVAMVNSKKAVFRGLGTSHPDPFYAKLEQRIMDAANETGVGPLGFGGVSTVAAVFIREAPTHIASLPVALNLNCHSLRCSEAVL